MKCDCCEKEFDKLYRLYYDPVSGYDGVVDENGKYKKEKYFCEKCSRKKIEEIRDKGYKIGSFEEVFGLNLKGIDYGQSSKIYSG